jgi:hypothetical protein
VRVLPVLLAAASIAAIAAPASAPAAAPKGCGRPDPTLPPWARDRQMTVVSDSVLLSGEAALHRGFPCWHVHLIGRPALMLAQAERQIRTSGRRVAPLVVVGVGYNSLWERNRLHHARWAARFDAEAARLLATLRRAGARQFIWVTLRHATRATTAPRSRRDLPLYSWYFPYVNAELRGIDAQRDRVVLADWARVGARPDVTYDSIHLNVRGGRLMQRLIERTLYDEARRQAAPAVAHAAQDPCANLKAGAPPRRPGAPRPPLVIGDSGALLAVAPLVRLGLEANARGCRPLSDAVSIMAARRHAHTLPRVVVLDVGANAGIDRALLRRALRIVGADGRLALVTATTSAAAAQAMRAFHARHRARTLLVDWGASGRWRRYGGDGIHIGYAGEADLARFILRHVRPYTPPHAHVRFPADMATAKDCGLVHPRGRILQVVVVRGRGRSTCALARGVATRPDPTALRYFAWFDWRFLGRPPWKDVYVRRDGRVIVATRTPPPAPGTDPPAR